MYLLVFDDRPPIQTKAIPPGTPGTLVDAYRVNGDGVFEELDATGWIAVREATLTVEPEDD